MIVIIAGLLIGLQVDDWNNARLDRKEAAYHLDFLYQELLENDTAAAAEIEQHFDTLMNSFGASALLQKTEWTPEETTRFKEQVFATLELWGPKHRPVSLRRMIVDGKLDLVESRELQAAILKYDSAYLDAIEQTRTSYLFSLELTPRITSSMRFAGPKIISTSEELTSSRELRSAVRDKAVWQRIQLDVVEQLQQQRKELLGFLVAHRESRSAIEGSAAAIDKQE
jgi:hypothetical protein